VTIGRPLLRRDVMAHWGNRVVVVSGASAGVGRAIVRKVAQRGAPIMQMEPVEYERVTRVTYFGGRV